MQTGFSAKLISSGTVIRATVYFGVCTLKVRLNSKVDFAPLIFEDELTNAKANSAGKTLTLKDLWD